jgi:hypothetical protein
MADPLRQMFTDHPHFGVRFRSASHTVAASRVAVQLIGLSDGSFDGQDHRGHYFVFLSPARGFGNGAERRTSIMQTPRLRGPLHAKTPAQSRQLSRGARDARPAAVQAALAGLWHIDAALILLRAR